MNGTSCYKDMSGISISADSNGNATPPETLKVMMQLYQAKGEIELLKERTLHADEEIDRISKENEGLKKQLEIVRTERDTIARCGERDRVRAEIAERNYLHIQALLKRIEEVKKE